MKYRIFPTSIVIVGLALILASQFSLVSAQSSSSTIISPLTAPVTFFKLAGKVKFIRLTLVQPKPIFTVQAVEVQTGNAFSDNTDEQGNYQLEVAPGKYRVSVLPFPGWRFIPSFRRVRIFNHDLLNINFTGFLQR